MGSTVFFVYVRQNSISEFGIQISNLSFYFHILHGILIFLISHLVPWGPKMPIGGLRHASNYSFFQCKSNGA